jgi:DNA (cytosine-5)-methyltransferase 1
MQKPAYKVPSTSEIMAVPQNGLTHASTFTGCGGSCLGYRWAGFRNVFANEFIEAARDSYLANFIGSAVDGRDIRKVTADDVMSAAGLEVGQLDVLEGSPPCASFSTAGRRSEGWGDVRHYSDTKQRVDDLFFEFARLLKGTMPRAFTAENVAGLVKGVAKGYFKEIFAALSACGYKVAARVLDAQWLGVPQSRQRVIFIGIRNDVKAEPMFPKPLPYRYNVKEVLPWIESAEEDTGGAFSTGDVTHRPAPAVRAGGVGHLKVRIRVARGFYREERVDSATRPAPTIGAGPSSGCGLNGNGGKIEIINGGEVVRRRFTIDELKRVCGFPDDFILTGTYAQQWERLGRSVPPPMMMAVASCVRDVLLAA